VVQKTFKISTGLKDLIGQDLITDDFVAVFELVKNCFDAHARRVSLLFEDDRIVVADDGKGMSHADILNKWLFVA
jgi:DNA mismatch repair ATPase MutL